VTCFVTEIPVFLFAILFRNVYFFVTSEVIVKSFRQTAYLSTLTTEQYRGGNNGVNFVFKIPLHFAAVIVMVPRTVAKR